jgi:hypothetical protein
MFFYTLQRATGRGLCGADSAIFLRFSLADPAKSEVKFGVVTGWPASHISGGCKEP